MSRAGPTSRYRRSATPVRACRWPPHRGPRSTPVPAARSAYRRSGGHNRRWRGSRSRGGDRPPAPRRGRWSALRRLGTWALPGRFSPPRAANPCERGERPLSSHAAPSWPLLAAAPLSASGRDCRQPARGSSTQTCTAQESQRIARPRRECQCRNRRGAAGGATAGRRSRGDTRRARRRVACQTQRRIATMSRPARPGLGYRRKRRLQALLIP